MASKYPVPNMHPTEVIIKPPITATPPIPIGDYSTSALIYNIEREKLTGCLRTYSATYQTKGATLLYQGRVVGCVHGDINSEGSDTTEKSFQSVLRDLSGCPDTTTQYYDLPDGYILGMSSLFVGYPVARSSDYSAHVHYKYFEDWIIKNRITACLALHETKQNIYVLPFNAGASFGVYSVKKQEYLHEKAFAEELFKHNSEDLELVVLPGEILSSSDFGFSPSKFNI